MICRAMESYEDLLREALPWIDQQFTKNGKTVSSRPLAAARIIVEHFLVEIKGNTFASSSEIGG